MRILKFEFFIILFLIPFFFLNSSQKSVLIKIGSNNFLVKLAETEQEKNDGLMFKRKFKDSNGMLFIYKNPRQVNFWMKNTFIPLAIIFIDENKRIKKIGIGNILSEEVVSSQEPVIAVLEIPITCVNILGLELGDKVSWSENFDKSDKNIYPCL